MRIAHFLVGRCNPDSANGVDKTVYYLTQYLAALGHEVAVFSLTRKPALPVPGVTVKTYSLEKFPFSLPKDLLQDLLNWKPDVVHMHSVYIPQNTSLARWLHKKRISYIITPHGGLSRYVTKRRWYFKLPYKYLLELPMLNRAAFVHAVADKRDIQAYGVRAPIVEAPNCIDLEVLPQYVDRGALWKAVPEAQGKRVLLFLGRLDPLHKGLDLLVEGFAKARLQNTVLVLIGPDRDGSREKLQCLTKLWNVEKHVFFPGPVYGTEKFDMLGAADVFVHTSRSEGLPFAVLEAMAMGLPCLLTPVADPAGMAAEYGAALVVEPLVESIAEGLRSLARAPRDDLRRMGKAARRLVEEFFTWPRTARILVEAYENYASHAVGRPSA